MRAFSILRISTSMLIPALFEIEIPYEDCRAVISARIKSVNTMCGFMSDICMHLDLMRVPML